MEKRRQAGKPGGRRIKAARASQKNFPVMNPAIRIGASRKEPSTRVIAGVKGSARWSPLECSGVCQRRQGCQLEIVISGKSNRRGNRMTAASVEYRFDIQPEIVR
jgi:hypothetical protein